MASFIMVVVVLGWNMTRGLKSGGGTGIAARDIASAGKEPAIAPRTWRFARNRNWSHAQSCKVEQSSESSVSESAPIEKQVKVKVAKASEEH